MDLLVSFGSIVVIEIYTEVQAGVGIAYDHLIFIIFNGTEVIHIRCKRSCGVIAVGVCVHGLVVEEIRGEVRTRGDRSEGNGGLHGRRRLPKLSGQVIETALVGRTGNGVNGTRNGWNHLRQFLLSLVEGNKLARQIFFPRQFLGCLLALPSSSIQLRLEVVDLCL